ncbi:hypothetical protein O7614_10470 [Micromonospora sp. WMMD961]|uniref:hypothetical protein n=1 Tax=Micromonospora sp. WMMD961 TaxID=3016100 RepID=UPI002417DC7B|nr:hypothetical protein [Micromonospora sp. WMMD961]MDG4780064.1 hypothetical protein [Micromonospora sp. WMMD961]
MIAAALLAAAAFPPADLPGRAFVMAIAAGGFATVVADLRAVAAVTGLGMATFVGFLANRFGDLTGAADGWSYAAVIVFASVLGVGYRVMRSVPPATARDAADGAVTPGPRPPYAAVPVGSDPREGDFRM